MDLSLLLEKGNGNPYPWAVNILDLGSLLEAWTYFGWGPERLCEYLDARVQLNGKILCSDELEVAGAFIQHGGLSKFVQLTADRLQLTPQYSDVFDDIHRARQGGEPVEYAPTEPFIGDVREMLAEVLAEEKQSRSESVTPPVKPKQGRNERCACGSGKKYKRCCGR